MYLLFYDYVDDILERRGAYRDEHLSRVRAWKDDGRITMAGAVGDPPHGALFVFDVEDSSAIDEFADGDPYVLNDLVTQRRIERWNVV